MNVSTDLSANWVKADQGRDFPLTDSRPRNAPASSAPLEHWLTRHFARHELQVISGLRHSVRCTSDYLAFPLGFIRLRIRYDIHTTDYGIELWKNQFFRN